MIKVLLGSIAGGVAMFIAGFLFWATPLNKIAFSSATEAQSAAVQLSLAQNLSATGYYLIPNPETSNGAVLYGKGPTALVNYNSAGFSTADPSAMIGGFIHEVVVSLMIALSLYAVAGRVTDFASRARLVVGLSAATVVMITLSDPIWMHGAWRFALYGLVADLAMMCASGLVIARWFVPTRAG
ncbi:hypothetical protein Q4F19_21145 [Sphingomonas sp. BIUV-7]|uniref:Uncharacterized protein n=1 Tax=Sphingomonas natans TaxID=3063330 RepID=A0ABT8YEX1_9SPHN|nr:hypothetical protein [Sphingomonas sp. BIUV-7]MDO6416904.1 hypothetical protein [Sphingomonas sp. BIUV-7]